MATIADRIAAQTAVNVRQAIREGKVSKANQTKLRKLYELRDKQKNPAGRRVPKRVLEGHRRIWGGTIPPGALKQLEREYSRMPGRKRKKKANPSRKRGLTAAPLLKVAREAGARRVQIMRNKSGKPTGVKFLR